MLEYMKLLRMLHGTTNDKRRLKAYLLEQVQAGKYLNTGHRIMLKQLRDEKINENGEGSLDNVLFKNN